jgi:uncharacterized protein (TIGR02145 family)
MGIFSRLWSRRGRREQSVKQEGFVESDCVTIGGQVWMSRNLNVSTFRNGDPIPEAQTAEEWMDAGKNEQPAWCYYNNDADLGVIYGRLYNWFAVCDKRGLAPRGWHVPVDQEYGKPENREFRQLISHLGGGHYAGGKLKEIGTNHWKEPNNNPADNKSGFTALPGGERGVSGGFYRMGHKGSWWTGSPNGTTHAYILTLQNDSGGAVLAYTKTMEGLSVRCLRD